MATAAVSIPQQIPHMPIPHVPRVRPPRILKGTPSPNSVPQPPGPVPAGKVWAQGRWRDPASNSAKASRHHQSQQVEKALRHDTHGQDIYAYANIRTNQVVYSLTRIMNNTKILSQLVYHGKKTVPAALRRDMWTPYFSLHFPSNEYGASSGLLAYHQLRELSKQRQLAPPENMVITTQEDVDRIKRRFDPEDWAEVAKGTTSLKLPKVGQLLPKELRARKLMSQKKTAVADLAFVLGLQAQGPGPEEAARLKEERRKVWWDNISRGAKARANKRAKLQKGKEEQLEKRRQMAMKADEASLGLDADAATRIAMEYRMAGYKDQVDMTKREYAEKEGEVTDTQREGEEGQGTVEGNADGGAVSDQTQEQVTDRKSATDGAEEKTQAETRAAQRAAARQRSSPREVRVLWADLRDAVYAETWPETVVHAELERMALAQRLAVEGVSPEATSLSVHVIGGQKGSGWYSDPQEMDKLVPGPKERAEEWEREIQRKVEDRKIEAAKTERRRRMREGDWSATDEVTYVRVRNEDRRSRTEAGDWSPQDEAKYMEAIREGEAGAGGAGDAGAGSRGGRARKGKGKDQDHETRQETADALRDEGIEVETPRKGLLAKAREIFGR